MEPSTLSPNVDSTAETWSVAIDYIVGRKRAEEALGYLAACSKALAGTPAYETALKQVAGYTVPFLADWCSIDLAHDPRDAAGEGGTLGTVAGQRAGRLSDDQVGQMRGILSGTHEQAPVGVADLAALDRTLLYSDAPGLSDPTDAETLGTLQRFGVRSALIVPIRARGRFFGVLTLARAGLHKQPRFGPADVALVEELGLRVAAALELARLQRTIESLTSAGEE